MFPKSIELHELDFIEWRGTRVKFPNTERATRDWKMMKTERGFSRNLVIQYICNGLNLILVERINPDLSRV